MGVFVLAAFVLASLVSVTSEAPFHGLYFLILVIFAPVTDWSGWFFGATLYVAFSYFYSWNKAARRR